jgi:hypothetical protein
MRVILDGAGHGLKVGCAQTVVVVSRWVGVVHVLACATRCIRSTRTTHPTRHTSTATHLEVSAADEQVHLLALGRLNVGQRGVDGVELPVAAALNGNLSVCFGWQGLGLGRGSVQESCWACGQRAGGALLRQSLAVAPACLQHTHMSTQPTHTHTHCKLSLGWPCSCCCSCC